MIAQGRQSQINCKQYSQLLLNQAFATMIRFEYRPSVLDYENSTLVLHRCNAILRITLQRSLASAQASVFG